MERHSEDTNGCEVVWSADAITVSGAIDAANATTVGRRVRALLTPGSVVVDCRTVTFIDVAGVRMLAWLGTAAIAMGAIVCLRCSSAMTQTLSLCGVRALAGLQLDHDHPDRPRSSP